MMTEDEVRALGFHNLEEYAKSLAKGLGLRLTKRKRAAAETFDDLSSGEARASQREATTGYMIEEREVIRDKALEGETREEKEQRLISGFTSAVWRVLLGPDHSATIDEVIAFLEERAADTGIDDSDIEADNKRPKVAPHSLQKMHAALADHSNAEQIKKIGVGNQKIDRKPKREDIRRQDAINRILGTLDGPGAARIPDAELKRLLGELRALQRKDAEAKRKM
jgi:hypothetical protein